MASSLGDRHAEDEEITPDEGEDIKDEEVLFKKISWVLLPLFLVMVVLCYVDRTNLAFAGGYCCCMLTLTCMKLMLPIRCHHSHSTQRGLGIHTDNFWPGIWDILHRLCYAPGL